MFEDEWDFCVFFFKLLLVLFFMLLVNILWLWLFLFLIWSVIRFWLDDVKYFCVFICGVKWFIVIFIFFVLLFGLVSFFFLLWFSFSINKVLFEFVNFGFNNWCKFFVNFWWNWWFLGERVEYCNKVSIFFLCLEDRIFLSFVKFVRIKVFL